jgi:hypothetical protein
MARVIRAVIALASLGVLLYLAAAFHLHVG